MSVFNTIHYYLSDEYWDKIGDPRINEWFMVRGGLWRVLLIILFYLLLVIVILPKFMEKRQPFNLRNTVMVYNVLMVMANLIAFIIILFNIEYGRIFFDFKYPTRDDRSDHTMWLMNAGWYLGWTRLIDLLDTVFFVLRKKYNQVSVLHLYHHAIVPILGWIAIKFNGMAPGLRLFALMNTFIHTVMYGYYALAALGPHMQKYLWWKKYITIIQLAQFVVMGVYGFTGLFLQEGYPTDLAVPFLLQPIIFFLMFYNFYKQTYKTKKSKNS